MFYIWKFCIVFICLITAWCIFHKQWFHISTNFEWFLSKISLKLSWNETASKQTICFFHYKKINRLSSHSTANELPIIWIVCDFVLIEIQNRFFNTNSKICACFSFIWTFTNYNTRHSTRFIYTCISIFHTCSPRT